MGETTRYSCSRDEAVVFDSGFACDYDAAGSGTFETLEKGNFGYAYGGGSEAGEEYIVLSEFSKFGHRGKAWKWGNGRNSG
jgi:hypothetical protein